MIDKRQIRDSLRLINSNIFGWLYIPHLLTFILRKKSKMYIKSDLKAIEDQIHIRLPILIQLLYNLHNNRYYRNLFYYRIGILLKSIIGWYRPGDRYFTIGPSVKIGKGFWFAHPYATIIAANSIGDNFRCIHLTTIGNTYAGKPTIGNNVDVGANVTIVGPVKIGNNVTIAAGSVVVKDIPDNCFVAGVPAKVIKTVC